MRHPLVLWGSLVCFAALPLAAQTFTGSITGRVIDASGSPVPGVAVKLTETATNTLIESKTNDTGDYSLQFLKPGEYQATYVAQGFKEQVRSDIRLLLNQALRLDVEMQVGDVKESVTVEAQATELNLVSPEVADVVEKERLQNIPLLGSGNRGRSPLLLAKLVPGVTSTSYGNINNFSFGGGRPVSNEILVDGLPTTNPSDMTYTLTPSPDALEEFKVLTFPFSSEYGHTGGGVMLLTSRAGTNQYHGSAYDLFRNRVLNGRNFFAPTGPLAKFVYNDPGGNLGGPLIVPHYDGRNKTFFFLDFNLTMESDGTIYNQYVPTDLERAGNFSQTLVSGKPVNIYNPFSTRLGADGKTVVRDLFPGAVIPPSLINATGSKIATFYPTSNGTFAGGLNYLVTPPVSKQAWQWLGRVDQNLGSSDRGFVRMGGYHPNTDAVKIVPNKANPSTTSGWYDLQAVVSETHVFSPRIVNDFRAGFVQEKNYEWNVGAPSPELGLKGVPLVDFPIVNVSPYLQLGSNTSNYDRDRSYVFNEVLNWQIGRHSVKMGGDYRRQMYNNYSPGKLSGQYGFAPVFTALPGDKNSGYALADLLLGLPAQTSFNILDYTYRLNINSWGMFFQDDYKISPRLTVNLGLRWEYAGPYSEANNQFASFNPYIINKTTGTPGDVQFAGQNGAPTHFSPNIYHDFLPRIGFSWRALEHTVIRSGFGAFRLPSVGYSGYGPVSKYQISQTFSSQDGGITPFYKFSDGVPARQYNVDANGNPNIPASLTRPTSSVTELEMRDRTPYNMNWSFGVQQQIGAWFAEANYVASKGVKLPTVYNLDQAPASLWSIPAKISSRPFPQYASVIGLLNDGNSFYHSLQLTAKHRFRDGFLFEAAYTFSKVIDDADAPARANRAPVQDVYNFQAERGIAGYDQPHRFVASYVWDVPLGRRGKYLTQTPLIKDVLNGWQFAGLTEYYAGLPVQVNQRSNNLGGFNEVQRPNRIADPYLGSGTRSLSQWFNTAAFAVSSPLQAGTSPRFPLRAPGVANWDFAMQRNFLFIERVKMQLRGEFFNARNHPNFSAPGNTIGNSNFGKVTGAGSPRNIELALRIFF